MKFKTKLFTALIALAIRAAIAGPLLTQTPIWTPGQTWDVEVTSMSEPPSLPPQVLQDFHPQPVTALYRFVVDGLTNCDGEICFCISIHFVPTHPSQSEGRNVFRIFVRQSPMSLKRIERLSIDGNIEASASFDVGPVSASDWVGTLPLEFPLFEGAGSPPHADEGKEFKHRGSIDALQESLPIRGGVQQITIKNRGGLEKECVQKWEAGKPWWTEAVLKLKDKEPYTAKLISSSSK